jgi:phosphatidylglycerophosphate synthase
MGLAPALVPPPPALHAETQRTRPLELKDPLNRYLYHPLAARLARLLQPTGISPNAVSVAGMLCAWSAGLAFASLPWPQGPWVGFVLLLGWHVIDGTDGDLARLTGRASATGELVDGLCDYGAQLGLYVVLAAMLDDRIGGWAWALAFAAALAHAVQTNHAESYRRSYLWWAYGVPWIKLSPGGEVRQRSGLARVFAPLLNTYLRVADAMAPHAGRIDAIAAAAAGQPIRQQRIRRLVRQAWRGSLRYEKLLGPNPRTIMLGLAMLLGSPLWFFLGELLLLNALLVVSLAHHNAVLRRLARHLGS